MSLDNRFLNIIFPSKSIPTRYDQSLDNINIHDIKSGIGNNDDCKTLNITVRYELSKIEAHPVIKPGYFLIKTNDYYLFPNDSIVLNEYDRFDDDFYYWKLVDWPKPGTPIIISIFKRNKLNKYIAPFINFKYKTEFSKKIINGVEEYIPENYEFIITDDKELKILKSSLYTNDLNYMVDSTFDSLTTQEKINMIKNNCEFVGQGEFGYSLNIYTTSLLPIKNIRIFTINDNDNTIKEWIPVRNLKNLNYNSLQHHYYVKVIPEFGLIVFGDDEYEYNIPSPQDKIYISYSAYPHIEYVPEFSSFITVPRYLDISPSGSGMNESIVQISLNDIYSLSKLELKSYAQVEDINKPNIYGPLYIPYDTAIMECTAYNNYGDLIPNLEIRWHFDLYGSINGYDKNEIIKTKTDFSGKTYATYHTPNTYYTLEEIILRTETDKYTINGSNIEFLLTNKNIYKLDHCLIYTIHEVKQCQETYILNGQKNSLGIPIVKCVKYDGNEAIVVNPIEYDTNKNIVIFEYNNVMPWYYHAPTWSEFLNSITLPYNLNAGFIFNHNKSEDQYHLTINGGVVGSVVEPIWNDEPCTYTKIDSATNPSTLKCINGGFIGWTIYTDGLVKIWCTAKDPLTGVEVRSNYIYMHIAIPFNKIGLHGFRFDTIPESLMDKDPLTI